MDGKWFISFLWDLIVGTIWNEGKDLCWEYKRYTLFYFIDIHCYGQIFANFSHPFVKTTSLIVLSPDSDFSNFRFFSCGF